MQKEVLKEAHLQRGLPILATDSSIELPSMYQPFQTDFSLAFAGKSLSNVTTSAKSPANRAAAAISPANRAAAALSPANETASAIFPANGTASVIFSANGTASIISPANGTASTLSPINLAKPNTTNQAGNKSQNLQNSQNKRLKPTNDKTLTPITVLNINKETSTGPIKWIYQTCNPPKRKKIAQLAPKIPEIITVSLETTADGKRAAQFSEKKETSAATSGTKLPALYSVLPRRSTEAKTMSLMDCKRCNLPNSVPVKWGTLYSKCAKCNDHFCLISTCLKTFPPKDCKEHFLFHHRIVL